MVVAVRRSVVVGLAAATLALLGASLALLPATGLAHAGHEGPSSKQKRHAQKQKQKSPKPPKNPSNLQLASEFLRLLKAEDTAGLKAFLAPEFLLQRPDGTYLTKAAYLKEPAVVHDFSVTDVVGTRRGDVRVLRYTVTAKQLIEGKEVTQEPVPRLSTYVWSGKRWQIISHANFTAIPK